MDDSNPYQAPTLIASADHTPRAQASDRLDLLAVLGWPIVFLANLAVPVLAGWGIVFDEAIAGCGIAITAQLLAGWSLCFLWPSAARRLLLGAVFTGLSQIIPVLHAIAGLVGFIVADLMGQVANDQDMGPGTLRTLGGGFLVTFVTGGVLLTCAGIGGFLVSLALPRRWFTRETVDPDSPNYQPR